MTQRQKNAQKQKQKETWKYRKEEINRKTDRLERRTRHQRGHGQSIGLVACNPLHSTWHRIDVKPPPSHFYKTNWMEVFSKHICFPTKGNFK